MASNCSDAISNFANETNVPLYMVYLPNEWISFAIIWPMIVAFGLLTNFTFILVVFRAPSLRTPTFIYLVHLSISDLILLLQLAFYQISHYVTSPIRFDDSFFGHTGCLVVQYITSVCFACSSGFVSLVSLERYLAICHPIYHHLVKGNKRTAKIACGMWLWACLVAILIIFYFTKLSHVCITWP